MTHPNMSSLNSKAVWGESPLMGAVARGQLEVVKALVEVEAIDVDTVDGQGRTLLQVARCAFTTTQNLPGLRPLDSIYAHFLNHHMARF